MKNVEQGFTLLEGIIVFAILMLLGSSAVFIFRNQIIGNLDGNAQIIEGRLQETQSKAVTGVDNASWGIHFDATTSGSFYAMFSGTSYATTTASTTTFYLSSVVQFVDPASNNSKDIVFNKRLGNVTASSSVTIQLKTDTNSQRRIDVSKEGKISVTIL